jgi:RluA family pseudouridine synthase
MTNIWTVDSTESKSRLNTFLKKKLGADFTSKEIAWAIEHNQCRVNGKLERFLSKRLSTKDRVEIMISKVQAICFEPKRVLFEDDYFLAYDKPSAIASTGEKGLSQLIGYEAVHRLDRDTTGVILLAKTAEAKEVFEALFKERKIKKYYLAIVFGIPVAKRGLIENQLGIVGRREGEVTWGVMPHKGGLPSKTEWFLEKTGEDCSLLRCIPHTGRTHQIRIHLSSIGHPILGDAHYGSRKRHPGFEVFRPYLHAEKIEFKHPFTQKYVVIEAPLPEDFERIEITLKK